MDFLNKMTVINAGNNFQIHSKSIQTMDELPAGTYKVRFSPNSGFSLEQVANKRLPDGKIYGTLEQRADKVIKAHKLMDRNLGVLLSGDKGMGKTLLTNILASKAIEEGMPVILVDDNFYGISDFLQSIKQDCLILFDEFEKVFSGRSREDGESQERLLGFFDGSGQQNHIIACTVNNVFAVNENMLNRTGRFHYHIQIAYPDADEVDEYLKDNLSEDIYQEQKDFVIKYSRRVPLNYDNLRAICFELNMGLDLKDALADLNISAEHDHRYQALVYLEDGRVLDGIIDYNDIDYRHFSLREANEVVAQLDINYFTPVYNTDGFLELHEGYRVLDLDGEKIGSKRVTLKLENKPNRNQLI